MLKEKLLNLEIFQDNEYLDKYINIIENNRLTIKEKYKTQSHHIIPRFYFRLKNIEIDNSEQNLINLRYKDHILAHYYLERRIKDNEMRGKNYFAIYKLCGSANISKEELYNILENNNLLDEFIKYKNYNSIFTDKHREKLSKVDKIMIYVHKDNKQTKIYPEKLEQFLNDGWIRGGLPGRLSEEHKAKLAASHKDMFDDNFKKAQSERLLKYYRDNPNWKTKSKKAVIITNPETGESITAESCLYLVRKLGIPDSIAKAGKIKQWVDAGHIIRPSAKYNNWLIKYRDI